MSEIQNISQILHQNQTQPSKTRARRTRHEGLHRDYICGCGKTYLSYPALFTHIKTKHDSLKSMIKQCSPNRKNGQNTQNKEKYDFLLDNLQQQELSLFLDKVMSEFLTPKLKEEDMSEQGECYVRQVKQYWKQHNKEELNFTNQVYQATIDQAFGLFLASNEGQMAKHSYCFLQKLIADMSKGLNELQSNDTYCQTTDASRLPLCMNDLFTLRLQESYCLQQYEDNRNLICIIIYHFNKWLLEEKLTNLCLRLNTP